MTLPTSWACAEKHNPKLANKLAASVWVAKALVKKEVLMFLILKFEENWQTNLEAILVFSITLVCE